MKKYLILLFLLFAPSLAFASQSAESSHSVGIIFFWIAILLLLAKMSGLIEKLGQPSVLGELLIGIVIGNLGLLGFHYFEPIKNNEIIKFLSELGVVLLLFQIGLESNIYKMKQVGLKAFLVACVGVVVPFALGTFVVGPWLAPELGFNAYLFIGATLTATSVGITARVFQDLKKIHLPEAQVVLGAAVIDDVLGLIILAIVSAVVTSGGVTLGSVAVIFLKAVAFLVLSILIGRILAQKLGLLLSKVSSGTGMKLTLALSFGLIFAYLAQLIGLAPIVGAFAAGLILDSVHFKQFSGPKYLKDFDDALSNVDNEAVHKLQEKLELQKEKHVEDLIEPIGHFLIPIFFVLTGMSVNIMSFADPKILLMALAITVAAVIGKVAAGIFAGKKMNRLLVGVGMIPRGEVGLIFAMMGKSLNVISEDMFSALVIMVVLTTLLTPPILAKLLKRA